MRGRTVVSDDEDEFEEEEDGREEKEAVEVDERDDEDDDEEDEEGQDEYEKFDFIVDDEEEVEEDEEDGKKDDSDGERHWKKKKKKRESEINYELDEDDYELLEDNNITGFLWPKPGSKFKRLKKAGRGVEGEERFEFSDEEEFVGYKHGGQRTAEEKLKCSLFEAPTPAVEEIGATTTPSLEQPLPPLGQVEDAGDSISAQARPTNLPSSFVIPGALLPSLATSLSPVVISDLLKEFVEQLERVMERTISIVSAGQGTFEAFRPFLINYMNNIRCLGDAQCIERCTEGISCLEEDLKALQDLERVDLEAQTELALVDIQTEIVHQQEVVQKNLAEKEAHIASLQEQHYQIQSELATFDTAIRTSQDFITQTREAIAQLQGALSQREVQLAQEEGIVKGLSLRSAEVFEQHCKEVQVLDEIKKEVAVASPSEEELRRRAVETARAIHEKKLSDVKSRLASVRLMSPEA